MITTNKFFHLPSLYVYILAAILLVTSVFHAAALLRQGLYVVLGLNDSISLNNYNRELIELTPQAQQYLDNLSREREQRTNTANVLRSAIMLIVSLSFFYFFWKRAGRSSELEMLFSVRHFYFFLVSTLAFLIFFFALTNGVSNLVQSTIVGDRMHYYNIYKEYAVPTRPDQTPEKRTMDLAELEETLAQQQQEYSMHWKRSQKRQVVDQLTIALVALPVFFFHDRRFGFSLPKQV